jgi:hypothetical protein
MLAEYAQEPKTEETAQKILSLQKDALAAKDASIFAKATLLLHETYIFLQAIPEALSVLRDALATELIEDLPTLLSLTDKWVSLLVKTEDFPALDAALTFRERLLTNNPAQALVQKFYRAVCQEGLKKYSEAIATLESINDAISNNNLVSKYLKLAMLRLKTGEPQLARACFEHAAIFDKTRKNEMFHLLESDLLFEEGDYPGALRKFEEFFLKTKSKNRYLDRYIRINTALGQYEEAWRFYQEYTAKLAGVSSKNYLFQFHQAGLHLAEKMNKTEEAASIKEKLLSIYDEEPVIHDAFDGVRRLFALSQKKTVFEKERDIYLESFRELAEVLELGEIGFFRPRDGEWTLYYPKKGLLLERSLKKADFSNTVLLPIIEQRRDYSLFTQEEMTPFTPFRIDPRGGEEKSTAIVMAFAIPVDSTTTGFLVAFLETEARFDFINKMLFTLKAILETRLGYYARLHNAQEEGRALARLGSIEGRGYAKIIDGTVYLMNQSAQEILSTKEGMFPYEKLQVRFQTENPLFLDRLIHKDSWNLPFRDFAERIRQLDIRVVLEQFHIFLSFKDVTEETQRVGDLQNKAQKAASLPIFNMHRFIEEYQSIRSQTALMGIQIAQEVLMRNGYSRSEILSLNQVVQSALQKAAKTHSTGLFLGEDGTLLLLLSTTDRRIVERIFSDFSTETVLVSRLSVPLTDAPIFRGAAINLIKGRTLSQNLDYLYRALNRSSTDQPLVFYDREMATMDQRLNAVRTQIEPLLNTGTIPLRYHQVGNLDTHQVEMYRIVPSSDVLPYSSEDIGETLLQMHSGSRYFWALIKQFVKDWVEIADKTHTDIPFAISVTEEVLLDPAFLDDLTRTLRKAKLPNGQIILVFRPLGSEWGDRLFGSLSALRGKGFGIGWEDAAVCLRIRQSPRIEDCDYLFIKRADFWALPSGLLSWMSDSPHRKLIVTEIDRETDARAVRDRSTPRIEGSVLARDLSVEQLIQTIGRG